ncbi:hypothetical protein BLA17378_04476 [Burkholderia aenigmatica]|uniref:Lipoprotein n=1 Tax=Burkholderia aenigmatica TaxID=2015348 RepID=A0ABY6XZS1_9BURK|nr:hypothetical protein [Burkholderia aenigmatica]VWC89618.1 hypothetical protein BLA17378_04476 [Burkholderia aenigmatica]
MKSLMLLCAAGAAMLAGCASVAPADQSQVLANVKTQVVKACAVATPTLVSLEAMSPQMTTSQVADLDKASQVIGQACSATSINIASVQDFVNVAIPAAIRVISASSLSEQDKTTAEIALTAASVAVSAALVQYAPAAVASSPSA